MVDKNDFTVYRKYEEDTRYFNYSFDMIKNELLNITEGFGIEDKIGEYMDDIEDIIGQITDDFSITISELDDLQEDYNDLEEEKEDLLERIKELEERIEELEG